MPSAKPRQPVPGTTVFDGEQARKGYALNKMCYSFNDAANRRAFVENEDAYCAKFELNAEQREAIRSRNVLRLIEAGGNAYYLAKFAGIFGLDMQDIGAQQTGLTKDQFRAKLAAAGDRPPQPSSVPSPPRTCRPSAGPSPRVCRTTRIGSRSSTVSRRSATGLPR